MYTYLYEWKLAQTFSSDEQTLRLTKRRLSVKETTKQFKIRHDTSESKNNIFHDRFHNCNSTLSKAKLDTVLNHYGDFVYISRTNDTEHAKTLLKDAYLKHLKTQQTRYQNQLDKINTQFEQLKRL